MMTLKSHLWPGYVDAMRRIFEKLDRYFYRQWHLGVLDIDAGRWICDAKASNIDYLKAQNAKGRHILIQPLAHVSRYYFLADDLSCNHISAHHRYGRAWRPGRLVIETSPGNYQVWIHADMGLTVEQKRYWLQKMGSDPSAHPNNRWGRCPGFRNRKEKYRNHWGYYPLAKLIWIDWKRQAQIAGVTHRCICRSDYQGRSESETDFRFAMALIRRGLSDAQVCQRIQDQRRNWRHHSGKTRRHAYLTKTVKKARTFVQINH